MISKVVFGPVRIGLRITQATLSTSVKLTEQAANIIIFVVRSQFPTPPEPAAPSGAPAAAEPAATDGGRARSAEPAATDGDRASTAEPPATDNHGAAAAAAAPAAGTQAPVETPPAASVPDDIVAPDDQPDTPLTRQEAVAKTRDDPDEIVRASSEPGAQDGAGAALHFDAPWDGYDTDDVEAVMARIATADAAELAVVELYEQTHQQRKPVHDAADRRLRDLSDQ